MYSSKIVLYILAALIATVAAAPVRHRRGTCRKPVTTVVLDVPTGTALPATAATNTPADDEVVSSTRSSTVPAAAAPTSTRASGSSTRAAAAESSTRAAGSSTRAASSSTAAPSASTGGAIGGLLGNLFPAGSRNSWTTSPSSPNALPLSDSTFRPTNVLRSVPHRYVNAPDGKAAVQAHYPRGSYTFGHNPQGGFSFYAPGPLNLQNAKEATFGYSVFFPEGFNFQLGGKLPGLYGGNSDAQAVGCSGGRRDDACFSARLMWRGQGRGEFYTYFPPGAAANQKLCNVAPSSHCNPTYGASVGTGSFSFATGRWTTVAERVKLNDIGQSNGEIELFVNGKSVINVSGLVLRTSNAGKFRGMQMQTFFGGSKPEFASPKDQDVYFSDFSVAITESF
ncbi:hypothetical protein MD484_g8714, partial [Candolleomyces efflorescens]